MVTGGEVVLRRTWPQRLVILMCLAVVGSALAAAWFVQTLYDSLADIPRIEIGGEVLHSETPPGEPVNFLLVGTDSARGIDPDDPILIDRDLDPEGRGLADVIMLLRLDPNSDSAWVLSIPRDLIVDIPGAQPNKINAALSVGGPELLVETVGTNFGVPINHYVQIDFLGFREIVDVLGGVPVWFPNPARDLGSLLEILTPGCHVLEGRDALAYVRGRQYEELIDGTWVVTGGDDFRRIERQQDFLVLALDRAIDRGARSPTTLGSLLDAGSDSVLLDDDLTLAELADLGQAFSEFNPENLERLTLQLYTEGEGDSYRGERILEDVNEPVFDVFRGDSDSLRPDEVAVSVIGSDEADVTDAVTVLASDEVGFEIEGQATDAEARPATVIVHSPGSEREAVLLARHVDPIPYVVEDAGATGVILALGDDYRGILFLFATPQATVEAAIAEQGPPPAVPDLGGQPFEPTTSAADPSASTTSTTIGGPDTGADPSASTTSTTTTAGIRGRPPEGESCG